MAQVHRQAVRRIARITISYKLTYHLRSPTSKLEASTHMRPVWSFSRPPHKNGGSSRRCQDWRAKIWSPDPAPHPPLLHLSRGRKALNVSHPPAYSSVMTIRYRIDPRSRLFYLPNFYRPKRITRQIQVRRFLLRPTLIRQRDQFSTQSSSLLHP